MNSQDVIKGYNVLTLILPFSVFLRLSVVFADGFALFISAGVATRKFWRATGPDYAAGISLWTLPGVLPADRARGHERGLCGKSGSHRFSGPFHAASRPAWRLKIPLCQSAGRGQQPVRSHAPVSGERAEDRPESQETTSQARSVSTLLSFNWNFSPVIFLIHRVFFKFSNYTLCSYIFSQMLKLSISSVFLLRILFILLNYFIFHIFSNFTPVIPLLRPFFIQFQFFKLFV